MFVWEGYDYSSIVPRMNLVTELGSEVEVYTNLERTVSRAVSAPFRTFH